MAPTLKQGLTVAAAVGAAAIGGTAMAGATGDRGETRSGADSARTGGPGPYGLGPRRDGDHRNRGGPGRSGRSGPQALTGATAEKVKSAALARVKGGTVLLVHADRDGGYEAHVRKADGTMVEVRVNRSFRVTAVEAHEHRGGARKP